MRKLITRITSILKDLVGEENWSDPVWSKVISAGILLTITLIFSPLIAICSFLTIYLYSLIRSVSVGHIIAQVCFFLGEKSGIPNWIIVVFLLFSVFWVIIFVHKRPQRFSLNKILKLKYDVDIPSKFLLGRWINQWTNGGTVGTEEVEIKSDMKYYKDGTYSFDIVDFEYSKKLNKIYFIKSSIRSMDFGKRFRNNLFILNNNLISGIEDGYEIKYKRFYIPEKISFDFMVGHWRNQWTDHNGTDFEICQINASKEYYTRSELFFILEDFKYNSSTRTIAFFKVPYQVGDTREKSLLELTIKDNDTLVGKEGESDIVFTREF